MISSQPFSLGFTLQELCINTTNSSWEKTFFDRSNPENKDKPIYKNLTISNFAFYLNVCDEFLLSHDPKAHLKKTKEEVKDYESYIEYKMLEMFPLNAELI